MVIALPGARGLLRHMQEDLLHMEVKMVELTRGTHKALVDLQWLAEDLSKRPTILYELVPLQPTLKGYHNVSRYICGRTVILGPMAVTCAGIYCPLITN